MSSHNHDANESIGDMIQTQLTTIGQNQPLESLMSIFMAGKDHALVVPGDELVPSQVLGILTKIDVLDYVATNCL